MPVPHKSSWASLINGSCASSHCLKNEVMSVRIVHLFSADVWRFSEMTFDVVAPLEIIQEHTVFAQPFEYRLADGGAEALFARAIEIHHCPFDQPAHPAGVICNVTCIGYLRLAAILPILCRTSTWSLA
jgi:hypothetical protein